MDYISARDAAKKWNTHIRVVQTLCSKGRIPGAKKYGNSWMIPASCDKPADPRRTARPPRPARPTCTFLSATNLPKNAPGGVFSALPDDLRSLAEADLAFRRGDAQPAIALWRTLPRDDDRMLSASSLAAAAAISMGDYALYNEIQRFLQACAEETDDPRDKALLSLPGVLASASIAAPDMTPDWLQNCDFSLFDASLRPFLLYLYAMHLRNTGEAAAALAVARTTLTLSEAPDTFSWLTVYLSVLCASAAFTLGNEALSRRYLADALSLAIPYGMIAPFADYLGALGGLLETMLKNRYPAYEKPTIGLWNTSFGNWMRFHNTYTREHIATVLTPQEYHVARLLVGGETYAGVSRRLSISVGRVKNVVNTIYGKLHIAKRGELRQYIL